MKIQLRLLHRLFVEQPKESGEFETKQLSSCCDSEPLEPGVRSLDCYCQYGPLNATERITCMYVQNKTILIVVVVDKITSKMLPYRVISTVLLMILAKYAVSTQVHPLLNPT